MIYAEIINAHPEREKIREALAILANSGILNKQREAMFAGLLAGSANENPDTLVTKILEYRQVEHALIGLQRQGEQIIEEIEGEK